ncbi:hypothetical protein ACIOTI_32670 [Streptomyces sp. NPDC087843]
MTARGIRRQLPLDWERLPGWYFRTTPRTHTLLDLPEYPDHDQGF